MADLLRYLADRLRSDPFFLAGCWPGTWADLAQALDCDEDTAVRVAVCATPTDEGVSAAVALIAAHFGLEPARVRAVLDRCQRHGEVDR